MPPPPFVPSTAPSSTASTAVAGPISSLTRFMDCLLRSPSFTSLVSNSPAIQQHPRRASSSPTPKRVMVQVQANYEASPSAAERWSPLRRTLPAKDVSPTQLFAPEPARMEVDDQTTPASPVKLDAVDDSPPLPTTER